MRAFCEPAATTSTPHSSCGIGTAPRPETASTAMSAPASCATCVSDWMSLTTPVEVSDSVVNTTFALVSARRRSSSAGSTRLPHPALKWVVSAPNASQSSTQRSPNLPQDATSAGSPGCTRFAAADSIAPEPEAAKQRTSLRVWKTLRRRSRQRAYTSMNAGAR